MFLKCQLCNELGVFGLSRSACRQNRKIRHDPNNRYSLTLARVDTQRRVFSRSRCVFCATGVSGFPLLFHSDVQGRTHAATSLAGHNSGAPVCSGKRTIRTRAADASWAWRNVRTRCDGARCDGNAIALRSSNRRAVVSTADRSGVVPQLLSAVAGRVSLCDRPV